MNGGNIFRYTAKRAPNKFCVANFWLRNSAMPISLNLELLEERLAFLDISCARLAEFVRKEARKREGLYSARERIQHKKRVNDYVMELAYNIKNEIELQELNITHTLHKKMIEIVRDKQQETRRAISRLQDGNKIYSLELRKRKERVVEIEKMHGKIFRLPKKLEIPIRRLKQEQVEPAMCLQENKFGSVRWLKQELVCSAQRLHQEQVKSTQSLQQEIERTLQTLFQGFVEITREVKQKYAEGSLRFPQTVARNAWKEAQAEIIQLKHRYAEITRLLQQEQTEFSLHIPQRQGGPVTYIQQGQEAPSMRLQQDQRTSILLPQKQSEPARRLQQTRQAINLRQNQVEQAIRLQQEQAGPAICLQQE
ncbi:hypothetical protein TNIN_16431, partial [Trichonephila inaurata madagascariensis]